MCCATPSSDESSPIVLKAPGAFSPVAIRFLPGDPVAHDLACAERHHTPRRDRDLDAGLGIAAHPLTLVAKDEAAEAGDLHVLTIRQCVAHVVKDTFDELSRF